MIKLPTLKQIYTSLVNGFETGFGISILLLIGKNFLRTLAATMAAEFKLFYLVIGFLQKNFAPDTADSELEGGTLERFGRISLGRNPYPATAGQYQVIVTGTPGAVIKASTTFKSDDSSVSPGYLFILDNEFTLTNASEYITLRALTPGVEAKLDLSNTLSATAPIILVNKTATVYTQVVEPRAAESIEAYRQAILNSYRLETQGGSAADYRLWSQDAQGVKQVYPFAKSGFASEVDVFVEATPTDSTDGKGTPSTALLNTVRDVIEFNPDITLTLAERGRRPANAVVNVVAVSVKNVTITIKGFVDPTAEKSAVIQSALSDLVNNIRPFVAAADVLENKNDILDVNRIISTIQLQIPGAQFTGIDMVIAGIPATTKTLVNGDITFLNTVLYA
jgi:uncharacterized phage protein gp47/JayE